MDLRDLMTVWRRRCEGFYVVLRGIMLRVEGY